MNPLLPFLVLCFLVVRDLGRGASSSENADEQDDEEGAQHTQEEGKERSDVRARAAWSDNSWLWCIRHSFAAGIHRFATLRLLACQMGCRRAGRR